MEIFRLDAATPTQPGYTSLWSEDEGAEMEG